MGVLMAVVRVPQIPVRIEMHQCERPVDAGQGTQLSQSDGVIPPNAEGDDAFLCQEDPQLVCPSIEMERNSLRKDSDTNGLPSVPYD